MRNVLEFKIPDTIPRYEEAVNFYEMLEDKGMIVTISEDLGVAGRLIQEHKYLMLNWINNDFFKPHSEWSDVTQYTINEQMFAFNDKLKSLKDKTAFLIGGESVLIKRARFVLRDIEDERQELARILGNVSEVLFLEFVVYEPDTRKWMLTEDYQVSQISK